MQKVSLPKMCAHLGEMQLGMVGIVFTKKKTVAAKCPSVHRDWCCFPFQYPSVILDIEKENNASLCAYILG